MKTSTRLILLLTMAVSGVMALVGYLALQLRADALEAAALDEVRAHAITLRIALEEDYATGRQRDAQRLLDRLTENTGIYGVILFNEQGEATVVSERLARAEIMDTTQARQVIASGQEIPIRRRINQEEVLSHLLPLQLDAQKRGAIEISLPVSFIEEGIAQERRIILAFLVALCLTIFLVVALVTNYSLVKPVGELLKGAEALGRGELHHHVTVPQSNLEFNRLAQAFNGMADSLVAQQRAAALAAEERLQFERRLRHHERLVAVGRLAAGVAHEIGAPLQVIDGRAKQLQDQPAAPLEKRQRNLAIIRAQTKRITHIVRNLLDFSRPFHPQPGVIDAAAVMTNVIEACEITAADLGVSIEHNILPQPVLVMADASLLQQVFMNICTNAFHAMSQGGRLRIDYVSHGVVKDNQSYTAIRIADTGGGIAPDNLPHIFDPYFTTKKVGHGTGLGLAVASRIIEEHGGWIEASNWEQGQMRGALFATYLPAATAEAVTTKTTPETVSAASI